MWLFILQLKPVIQLPALINIIFVNVYINENINVHAKAGNRFTGFYIQWHIGTIYYRLYNIISICGGEEEQTEETHDKEVRYDNGLDKEELQEEGDWELAHMHNGHGQGQMEGYQQPDGDNFILKFSRPKCRENMNMNSSYINNLILTY